MAQSDPRVQLPQLVRERASLTDSPEEAEKKASTASSLLDEHFALAQPTPAGFPGWYTGSDPDRRARSFRRFWLASVASLLHWPNVPKESELPDELRLQLRARWPSTLESVGTDARLVKLPAQLARSWSLAHLHSEREHTLSQLEQLLHSTSLSCLSACLQPTPRASLVQVVDAGLSKVHSHALARATQNAVVCESQLVLANEIGRDPQMRLASADIDARESCSTFLESLGSKLRNELAYTNSNLSRCMITAAERALTTCAHECARCSGSLAGVQLSMERRKVLSFGRHALAARATEVMQEALLAPSLTPERRRLSQQQANAVREAVTLLAQDEEQQVGSGGTNEKQNPQPMAQNKWEYLQHRVSEHAVESGLASAVQLLEKTLEAELRSLMRSCVEELVSNFVPKDDIIEEFNEELGSNALDEHGGLLVPVHEPKVGQVRVASWREYYDPLSLEEPESRRMEADGAIARPLKSGRAFSISNTGAGEGSVLFEANEKEVARGIATGAFKAANEDPMSEDYMAQFRQRTREEQEKKNRTKVEGLEKTVSSTRLMPTKNNIAQSLSGTSSKV